MFQGTVSAIFLEELPESIENTLSRLRVTWLVTNGFWIGRIDLLDLHQSWLQIIITLLLIYTINNHSTLIFSMYFNQPSLYVSWQRIYNIGTIKVSLNYTFPISLFFFWPHWCSLGTLKLRSSKQVKVKVVTTDGQSVSLSWNKAPIWDFRPCLYSCLTVVGFLMWGALSDERTGLSFASHSQQY
jgi:hypothetical protein